MSRSVTAEQTPPENVSTLHNEPSVLDFMERDLRASGISIDEVEAEIAREPFSGQPIGYRIPYWLPDGTKHPLMYRVRLAQPKPGGGKYTQPDKATFAEGTYPYLHPSNALPELQRGPGAPPLIVEGEKKAYAAIKYLKRVAFGIGGCWNWSKTTDEGLHLLHGELAAQVRNDKVVEIVFDGDLMRNVDVQRAAGTLRRRLRNLGVNPVFVMLPLKARGGGLDDWIIERIDAGENPQVAFEQLPRTDGVEFLESNIDAWDDLGLVLTAGDIPFNNESNVARVLNNHDYFAGLRFNTTMKRMEFDLRELHLTDAEIVSHTTLWLQSHLGMQRVTTSTVRTALEYLCSERGARSYNAVGDKLKKCAAAWDGKQRLDTFFVRILGLQDTPYARAVTRAFFIGASRRALHPGCKMDYVLILTGKGGVGKTTLFQHLAMEREWVKEITESLDRNKDGRMALTRGWIVEASEGVAFDLASAGGMKAIITDTVDEFRPPYGVSLQRYPRCTVLVASTNDDAILKHEAGSGNRRFLPLNVRGRVNLAAVDAEIEQVWGEAVTRMTLGEREWEAPNPGELTLEELALPEQHAHTEADPWTDDLTAFLSDPTHLHRRVWNGRPGFGVTSHDLLTGALGLSPDRKIASHGKRLRRAMASVEGGWERVESFDRTAGNAQRKFIGYWRPE